MLVVGGGPAGLTAALAAARAGRTVTLVDAAATLGGMAASPTVAGQRVDLGSHRLHPSAPPPVARLLDELLGADLQTRPRRGRIRLADRWLPFPFGLGAAVRGLPPAVVAGLAVDQCTRPLRRPRPGADTYAEVVRVGLGPRALARFHGPMAAKLWGIDPAGLAGDLARRRIPVRSPGSVITTLVRSSGGRRVFRYPRLGYGQIVERLAEAAVEAGAELRTAMSVRVLRPEGDGAVVETGDGNTTTVGRVLWTAPLEPLLGAAGGPPELAAGAGHRGVVLVYLVVPRPQYSPFDAHYVADPAVAFSRLSEPKNYRDGPDPADRTVLCAEVPATVGDATWCATDAELAELVLAGLDRCGLPGPAVDHVEVRRLPRVYPVLTPESVAARARLLAWSEALPGVTVLGRQGLLVADNLHHVLDMALSAVSCLGDGGTWDRARWAAARSRFDGFVVDD